MTNLKQTLCLMPLFVFMNCVTPVILKQNLKSKSKNLEIEIVKLTDGPNGFASGGKQFHPKSNDMRLIHVTVALKNLKTTDYDVIVEKIALEPTYATILDDKGKEIKKLNSPAFVRYFEVDTWNDVKEDVSGNNFATGKIETKLTLKPGETLTRTLIYFLPKNVMPEKLIFLDEQATAIVLK